MNYTQCPYHAVHAPTGYTMFQDDQAIPAIWTARDGNSVFWSLMEVVKEGNGTPKQFNPDDPESYRQLLYALRAIVNQSNHFVKKAGDRATGAITAPKFMAKKGAPTGNDSDVTVGFAFDGPDGDTGMFAEGGTENAQSDIVLRIDGAERLRMKAGGHLAGNGGSLYNTMDLLAVALGATPDLSLSYRNDLSLTFTARGPLLTLFCQARIDASTSSAGANDVTMFGRVLRLSDGAQIGSGRVVVQSLSSGQGYGLFSAGNLSLTWLDGTLVKGTQYRLELLTRKTVAIGPLYLKDVFLAAINA